MNFITKSIDQDPAFTTVVVMNWREFCYAMASGAPLGAVRGAFLCLGELGDNFDYDTSGLYEVDTIEFMFDTVERAENFKTEVWDYENLPSTIAARENAWDKKRALIEISKEFEAMAARFGSTTGVQLYYGDEIREQIAEHLESFTWITRDEKGTTMVNRE